MSKFTEIELKLVLATPPPNQPPASTTTSFPEDEIEDLGDRLAALTPAQAKELQDYLEYFYGY